MYFETFWLSEHMSYSLIVTYTTYIHFHREKYKSCCYMHINTIKYKSYIHFCFMFPFNSIRSFWSFYFNMLICLFSFTIASHISFCFLKGYINWFCSSFMLNLYVNFLCFNQFSSNNFFGTVSCQKSQIVCMMTDL